VTLKLYNTLTRDKQAFEPIDKNSVRMYVCGPTVYDFAHIGNARPVIVFDVLFRLLRHVYGEAHVTYVRNITDVDDKINARAGEEYPDLPLNEAISKVTAETTAQFHKDIAALGVLEPTVEPTCTGHIDQMRTMIEVLVDKGCAYVAEEHVLFDVSSAPGYGALARRTVDDMIAGARVDVAPYKKGEMDFVLWKPSSEGQPGWPSPCDIETPGRPGWHIECSAMAKEHLGEVFDIHGGGIDLTFPHHENELAQSRCAHGTDVMANVWMHNGYLQVEGEKMSKSLGNFITIHELLETEKFGGFRWPGEVIRFAMLMTHYRQPLDFSQSLLEQASIALGNFATVSLLDERAPPSSEFMESLLDDLNTPRAIAELHRLSKLSRDGWDAISDKAEKRGATLQDSDFEAASQLAAGLNFLGIDIASYDQHWVEKQANARISADLRVKANNLVIARIEARTNKDFAEADRIRDELDAMGIQLMDAKDPETGELVTTWEVKR